MRLIDADEIRIKPEYMHDICGSVMIRVEDVARIINEMPTINPQPHWIPCSERPPEPRIDVWCNSDMGQMVGFYDETTENWYKSDYSLELIVDAWMPLPDPYQPKED